MSEAPYIQFYTSDFLAGTSGMTASTKGVYITLLSLMYEAEAPLPQQWDTLARRCGCTLPAFKKAIQSLVDDGKVAVVDAGIWSEKCEKHIAQRRERRNSAKAAANTRWQKTEQKQGKPDATAVQAQCQPEPEPKEVATATSSAQQREDVHDPDLVDEVMAAVGLTSGRIPTHWLPPGSMVHVNRWVTDLGLTRGEIVAAARSSRQQHSEPPNGPKALDRVMQSLSQAKAGGRKLVATDDRGEAVPTIPRASPVPADGADIPSESFPDTLPPADPKFATR